MDDRIIAILTEALGDAGQARMVNALHRQAVTIVQLTDRLAPLESAMQQLDAVLPGGDTPPPPEVPS